MGTEPSGYNHLSVELYTGYSLARIADAGAELPGATVRSFDTFYGGGGLYGSCEIYVPRDVTQSWPFAVGQRLVIRNGLTVVWEGALADTGYDVGSGAAQGRVMLGLGYWGWLLSTRGINKPWADTRIGEDLWPYRAAATGSQKCTVDRLDRIRFTPKAVAWSTNEVADVEYTAPTGQTVKRVTWSYDLQEVGQAWTIDLLGVTGTSVNGAVSSSGTGTQDVTLATPSQKVRFRFIANNNQTPAADGTIYGEFSNIVVYTETGSINAQEIAIDVVGLVSSLNSSTAKIGALTLSLVPFVTEGWEMMADLLARAVAYGDASFNSWAVYLAASESAASPDGKPVLVVEQQPALSDYDYNLRVDEAEAPFSLRKDGSGIRNHIIVKYQDENDPHAFYLSNADNGNLDDDTSIAAYGERQAVVDAGLTNSTVAVNLGRRVLAARKDPRFYVSGSIRVKGALRAKNGNLVPASEVAAGKRIRVEDFLTDEVGVSGAGLTFLISSTRYDDESETVEITCGVPDDLAVLIAQMALTGKVPGFNDGLLFAPVPR